MKFQKLLKKLALFSDHHQHKLSCILADKNKIISMGYNELRTHTKSTHPYKSLHAEISALLGLTYEETKGLTAYIYRQRKDGSIALAKPCESCFLALQKSGIKKIVYTDYSGWKEERL